jgi:hypothetical protein
MRGRPDREEPDQLSEPAKLLIKLALPVGDGAALAETPPVNVG